MQYAKLRFSLVYIFHKHYEKTHTEKMHESAETQENYIGNSIQ